MRRPCHKGPGKNIKARSTGYRTVVFSGMHDQGGKVDCVACATSLTASTLLGTGNFILSCP